MHEYTGDVKDPQWHTEIQMNDDEITESVKKMLDEPISECSKIGLRPFYALLPLEHCVGFPRRGEDDAAK